MRDISNSDDVVDSRDIIERIEELEGIVADAQVDYEEAMDDWRDSEPQEVDPDDDDYAEYLAEYQAWEDSEPSPPDIVEEEEELEILRKVAEECEGYSDWKHGETLIRETYWEEYVEELCKDCGYLDKDLPWWIEIDWKKTADNVAQDYTIVDWDGIDYYIRSC